MPMDEFDDEPNREEAVAPRDEDFQQLLRQQTTEERQRHLLDDLPISIRKRLHEDDDDTGVAPPNKRARVSQDLVTQVMLSTLVTEEEEKANEWVSRYELSLLRELTGLPITAARLHRQPRKRLARPPKMASRARLSILLGKDPQNAFVVEENTEEVRQHPPRKAGFPWKGITMYYKEAPKKKGEKVRSYVEKDGEIYEVCWSSRQRKLFEREWLAEMKDVLMSEVMLLRMKASGKELDPRFFSEEERSKFAEADKKEWAQWIQNGVIKRLSPDEQRKVPREAVFKSPMRMVRVNKQQKMLLPLLAKSRLVILGHRDPHLGLFRTDAPTTSLVSVRMAKAISQFRSWICWSFDVTTAFLSGLETDRQIYVKAPAEGLPAAEGWSAILPFELLRILKSAYGLTEAPRLWYLRAVQLISQTPLKELPIAKATFAASEGGISWAILCLHVDDGLLLGDPNDSRFVKLKAQLNKLFKIKEWKETPLTFLGVDLEKAEKGGLCDNMGAYIRNIKVPEMQKKKPDEPLDTQGVTQYRQLTMRLRWPAQLATPHKLYEISSLAQRVNQATYKDFQEAVKLHQNFLEEEKAGRAKLRYPTNRGRPYVLSFFDASLGKETDGRSQLGSIHFLTTDGVKEGPQLAAPLEFHTSRSTRVVRSSMAAESNSMSLAVDKHLYLRALLDMLWFGDTTSPSADWRSKLRHEGGLVTDAKSLYDHVHTTGHVPSERQTMLDLLVAKDMLEQKAYQLFWVPTHQQQADVLTKRMKGTLWESFCQNHRLSLKQTDAERRLEEHRQRLRKDQRQRRKVKFGRAKAGSAGR